MLAIHPPRPRPRDRQADDAHRAGDEESDRDRDRRRRDVIVESDRRNWRDWRDPLLAAAGLDLCIAGIARGPNLLAHLLANLLLQLADLLARLELGLTCLL